MSCSLVVSASDFLGSLMLLVEVKVLKAAPCIVAFKVSINLASFNVCVIANGYLFFLYYCLTTLCSTIDSSVPIVLLSTLDDLLFM